MRFRKQGKAVAPYIVGGIKISLDVLSKITSLIHPPCVGAVIGAASQIITVAEGMKSNRDDTKTLIERLLGLLVVISDSYQGKDDVDLAVDIITSMKRLSGQLDSILAELGEMQVATDLRTVKGFIKGGLLYKENGQKIKGYTTRINWAIDTFQVEGRIQDAIRLRDIQSEVSDMHAEVKNIRENMTMGSKSEDTLLFSTVLPSRPEILYGREEEVNSIAERIVSTPSPRFAILGAGGIGKTAVLLAVREHPDVEQKFGESRFFVRCEEATSLALFIELIARSLHIEPSSSNRMNDIKTRLRSADRPTLLLFDNFETTWDIPGEQTRVEETLCFLASFPHVAILITMRSNVPPSTHVPWSLPWLAPLPVLSKEAARDLYVNIDPNAVGDLALDTLLAELSYMPLAITLMASLGRTGETPTALVQAWKDKMIGTDLLHGTDKTKSINISIRLSIESNLMTSVPEALTLLSAIAVLPAGANTTLLPTLVPSIQNLVLAKATLRGAALTSPETGTHTLQLLSPIRAHVMKYYPLSADLKKALYDAYMGIVAKHSSKIGDIDFIDDLKVLGEEETNLEVLLPDAIKNGSDDAIDAAITFSGYQLRTRPRLEVIQSVVQVCRQKRKLDRLAYSMHYLGRILIHLCHYEAALAAFAEGHRIFTELGHSLGAAICLESSGNVHMMQGRYGEAQGEFQKADRMYTELSYWLGVASCLQGLGDVHRMQGRYEEAQAAFKEADRTYARLGDQLGAASCFYSLGDIHRLQGRYDEAREEFQEAGQMYAGLGDRLGAATCLESLGHLFRMQGRYEEAQAVLQEADQNFKDLGHRIGAANCLQGLGDVYLAQGRYNAALTELQEAYRMYAELGDRRGTAGCLQSLGQVHRIQGRYEDAWRAFQEGDRAYNELGDRLGTANCLKGLAYVQLMRGPNDQAWANLSEARGLYFELGLKHQAAACSRILHSLF